MRAGNVAATIFAALMALAFGLPGTHVMAQNAIASTVQIMPKTAAEDPEGARAFILALSADALEVLDDTTLTQEERDAKYRDILAEGFALDYIARLVLGRHGRSATKAQLAEYTKIFPDYILNIYVHRLTEYGDEQFIVSDTTPAGKKDIFVRSEIVRPDGPPIAADWRVRIRKGEFKIIDLKIEGISMAATQRERFSAKIAKVGIDGLIESLKDDAGLNSAESANPTP